MQHSLSHRLGCYASSGLLLRQYDGAAAAYSLQKLGSYTDDVVRVRRSTDNTESDFNDVEVTDGSVREFALNNDTDIIRFADQAAASDKRMYFDGVNDYISVAGMTATTDYFGACTIEATIYMDDASATECVWALGSTTYALRKFANLWYVNSTSTGITPTSGIQTVAVDYNASGQGVELRVNGVTVWTGTAAVGTSGTSFYIGTRAAGTDPFAGIIYDFSLSGSAVKNFSFNGYGNANADWEDQVGSNDGTVNGSPALFSGQGFNAYVTTLYDQSGNSRNATQATAASQPQIVANGVVVTDSNGNPAIEFDGTDDFLDMQSAIDFGNTNTVFWVFKQNQVDAAVILLAQAQGGSSDYQIDIRSASLNYRIGGAAANNLIGGTTNMDQFGLLTYDRPTSSTWTGYRNGAGLGTDASTNTNNSSFRYIGDGGTARMDGQLSEVVIYGSTQSANRAAIEANIAGRYGVTLA